MPIFNYKKLPLAVFTIVSAMFAGCQGSIFRPAPEPSVSIATVPAVRMNYRFEADVPPPAADPVANSPEDRHPAVLADFDSNRLDDTLYRTIVSPDKARIVAVYRATYDREEEYRLELYSADGKILQRLTADNMGARFPDLMIWSPDSQSFAFAAAKRVANDAKLTTSPTPTPSTTATETETNAEATPVETSTPLTTQTANGPKGLLVFNTEQIYVSNSEGTVIKPLTENEGMIYFNFSWAPDSSMLVALAATEFEWERRRRLETPPDQLFIPKGRPRLIEKNGRERRLDDNTTEIWPVWSPDSSKVAVAYDVEIIDRSNPANNRRDTRVRVYDAGSVNPSQAEIPLRNQLLSAAREFEQKRTQEQVGLPDANLEATPQPTATQPLLPDQEFLIAYNPIVDIVWSSPDMLYLHTEYVKRFLNPGDDVRNYSRWHRLVFSVQPQTNTK